VRVPDARLAGAGAILAAAAGAGLWLRPLLPVDETRYLTVAWEMWSRGDWLVPYLNGTPYFHKPPLLFWSILAAWWAFGVSETLARIVPVLYGGLCLVLVHHLARLLWPERTALPGRASLLLVANPLFVVFAGLVLFDAALTATVLIGMVGLVMAARGAGARGWAMVAAGVALGLLAKGPVVLVHLLPAALAMPVWADRRQAPPAGRWYAALALAVLAGALAAAAWALPAILHAGEGFARQILWTQTAGRVVSAFDHARPWWFYLPLVLLLGFPLALWPPALAAAARLGRTDPATRLLLAWLGGSVLLLSAISGKQAHYLLPAVPAGCLIAARVADALPFARRVAAGILPAALTVAGGLALTIASWPGIGNPGVALLREALAPWLGPALAALGIAALMIGRRRPLLMMALLPAAVLVTAETGVRSLRLAYDLHPIAARAAAREAGGLAFLGEYHGQLTFLGRLTAPVTELADGAAATAWLDANPGGSLIEVTGHHAPFLAWAPLFAQPYRGRTIGLWEARPPRQAREAAAGP